MGVTDDKKKYDVVILGGGHNGLVSACYLAKAGLEVLVLERNPVLGGATQSASPFRGFPAKLSIYSYLISLLPDKIINDLGLRLELKTRGTASWTPELRDGRRRDLLLRNNDTTQNREAILSLTGRESDYRGWLKLQDWQADLAEAIWPSLTQPLVSKSEMAKRCRDRDAWRALIEKPLGPSIESLFQDDLLRGVVFTDARIGVSTYPDDPSLLQNRCFLYHVIGRGTGEWSVPVGGMGCLVGELIRVARETGRVTMATSAEVRQLHRESGRTTVSFAKDDQDTETSARFVLCNASAEVLERLLGRKVRNADAVEGAGFKINMLLEKLPQLCTGKTTASEAFAGTVHIDEGYEQMRDAYHQSISGSIPETPPGEIYCHTLTDDSILDEELRRKGFHTLTLFGLDLPYRLFEKSNDQTREEVVARYLAGINRHLEEPIESCLAEDENGAPCLEAMSAYDLEKKLCLPKGNIFHGDLTWPFAESDEEIGQWGVETGIENIYICGSAAKRGGAVSGIPGHNAAMKVLERC